MALAQGNGHTRRGRGDESPRTAGVDASALGLDQRGAALATLDRGHDAPVTAGFDGSPLDLHEAVSHPAANEGCKRAAKALRLLGSNGALVPVRCRASNLCDYCARLAAVEWSEMLALDALEGSAPSVWIVLTTADTETDPARFYKSREQLMRAVKRRWPEAEYVCVIEFTTGYGPKSGGERRPHWNVLLKGVPATALPELEALVAAVWCSRENANPSAQFVGAVSEVGGLMRYLALHFLKESQRPPKGWGAKHRVTASRGYFTRPRWQLRAAARDALRLKRAVHRAEADGLRGTEALTVAEADRFKAEAVRWECVVIGQRVNPHTGQVFVHARRLDGGEPTAHRVVCDGLPPVDHYGTKLAEVLPDGWPQLPDEVGCKRPAGPVEIEASRNHAGCAPVDVCSEWDVPLFHDGP